MRKTAWLIALLPFALAACEEDGVGPEEGEATVAVRFAATAPSASQVPAAASLAAGQQELRIAGENGTLVLTDVVLVVAEFELKRDERIDECDASGTGNPCRRFEAPPFLLRLPLGTGTVEVVADQVPLGTYTEFEFEVEDLDEDDDDDAVVRQGIGAVRQQIAQAFPGVAVPAEASLFVRGRFEPEGGAARPFLTLFDADIEVELELVPALVITEEGATRVITVNLDPARFFTADGEVMDLSEFDFATTRRLVEFEAEFEAGFEAEIDD